MHKRVIGECYVHHMCDCSVVMSDLLAHFVLMCVFMLLVPCMQNKLLQHVCIFFNVPALYKLYTINVASTDRIIT